MLKATCSIYDNPSHKCDGADTFLQWSLDGTKVNQSRADTFFNLKMVLLRPGGTINFA